MRSKDRQQSTGILFTRRAMNAQYDDCGCSSNGGGQPTWCSNRCDERQRDVSVCLVVKKSKNKYKEQIQLKNFNFYTFLYGNKYQYRSGTTTFVRCILQRNVVGIGVESGCKRQFYTISYYETVCTYIVQESSTSSNVRLHNSYTNFS